MPRTIIRVGFCGRGPGRLPSVLGSRPYPGSGNGSSERRAFAPSMQARASTRADSRLGAQGQAAVDRARIELAQAGSGSRSSRPSATGSPAGRRSPASSTPAHVPGEAGDRGRPRAPPRAPALGRPARPRRLPRRQRPARPRRGRRAARSRWPTSLETYLRPGDVLAPHRRRRVRDAAARDRRDGRRADLRARPARLRVPTVGPGRAASSPPSGSRRIAAARTPARPDDRRSRRRSPARAAAGGGRVTVAGQAGAERGRRRRRPRGRHRRARRAR